MLLLYNLILILFFIFIFYSLHCPLSGPDLTYISLLIIPCIIYHVTNKETLNLEPWNSKIYKFKLFYWECSSAKIQYVGTERQTNLIINNIGYVHFCMFRSSELPCVQKCKQCKEREVMGTFEIYLFMCLIDMNKFFEKHLLPLKNV